MLTRYAMMAVFAAAPLAAQYASYYVMIGDDGDSVIAAAVTDTNYTMGGQHVAYATLRLRSPTGRLQERTAFQAPSVVVTDMMYIGTEDGEYLAENWPAEWCPIGSIWFYYGLTQQRRQIKPFVRLKDLSGWSPPSVKPGQTATLQVEVEASDNVRSADVRVFTSRSYYPTELESGTQFSPPSGYLDLWVCCGRTALGEYRLNVLPHNTTAGKVGTHTYISSWLANPDDTEIRQARRAEVEVAVEKRQ
jgi:hypothetical protein